MTATSSFAVTIGFSQVGDEGDWRPAFSKDMQAEAKAEGIDLKFADAQGKEEEQLKAVRACIARKKGFEAVIANFPNMKIVKTQSGDFTTDGGKKVMEAFIKSTDNLKGICASFAHNDNMQLGAIQAMKEAGLKPGKDVQMVSVD